MNSTLFTPDHIELFRTVAEIGEQLQMRNFIVGGIVRDMLRAGSSVSWDGDIDIIVEGDAAIFAERCMARLGGSIRRFDKFLTAKIESPNALASILEIDFATAREERYEAPGKLPVVRAASFEEDLKRRDFSINTLAVRISDLLNSSLRSEDFAIDAKVLRSITIDTHNGISDLDNRVVRVLHKRSFGDDPTRLFRGCRYAGRMQGILEEQTAQYFAQALEEGAMATLSTMRIASELRWIARERQLAPVWQHCIATGLSAKLPFALPNNATLLCGGIDALQTSPDEREWVLTALVLAGFAADSRPACLHAMGLGKRGWKEMEDALKRAGSAMEEGALTSRELLLRRLVA